MHALWLTTDLLGLALGNVIVHPKICLPTAPLTEPPLHQFVICRVTHPLITTVTAAVLTFSGVVIVVIPAVRFKLAKGEILVVVCLVGRLVRAAHKQN